MYRIFIVEDDPVIATQLEKQLQSWSMETCCAQDFHHILPEFEAFSPHLVLLDISLPFFNGYHWCTEIRKLSNVPVVFLSSMADNMNIVMAMNMGGDDFISKPFDATVLVAKLQAILRRTYDLSSQTNLMEYRGATLNTADATLQVGQQHVELSKNEYRIFLTLLEHRGQVVSRQTLMERLWATDSFIDENTLSVNIARLRRKLAAAGLTDAIDTKKGLGYLVE